jgi:hypothetical protein
MSAYFFQFVGTAILSTFNVSTPTWEHYLGILPAGIGFGGTITILLIALISSVPIQGSFILFGANSRPSSSDWNELSLPKHWLRRRYHHYSMRVTKFIENMAHQTNYRP